jgi:hypothetical protein
MCYLFPYVNLFVARSGKRPKPALIIQPPSVGVRMFAQNMYSTVSVVNEKH